MEHYLKFKDSLHKEQAREYSDKWLENVPIIINEYHKSLHEKKFRRCLSELRYKYMQRCVRIYEKMPTH